MSRPHAHLPRVALYPPDHVPDYIKALRAMIAAIGAKPGVFPSAAPLLATLGPSVDALDAAEVAVKTGPHGAAAARDQKLLTVRTNVAPVLALVQQLIFANPANAEAIAADAGLHLHKSAAHGPQQFTAREEAGVPGSVHLTVPSNGGGAHAYRCSVDGGKTWSDPRVSDRTHVTYTGLPIGVTVEFQHKLTLHGVEGDWNPSLSFVVR